MNIVVHCNHIDHGGGGTYSNFLIRSLMFYGDVYIANDHPPFVRYWGKTLDLPRWTGGEPDLFVCIDHRYDVAPIGRKNLRVLFYPFAEMQNARLYDAAVVMNPFVGRATVKELGLFPYIIPIGLDPQRYTLGLNRDKENILLVVANFFREEDGHSKHQDKIIKWFITNNLGRDWRLILIGGGQQDYYDYCRELARYEKSICFTGQLDMDQVAHYYPTAKFLIHANGFERTDPAQTEHFGIVAVEAMLSGCQPIVHDSGGCREIDGVWKWSNWGQLTMYLHHATNPVYLRSRGEIYNPSRMIEATGECVRGVLNV